VTRVLQIFNNPNIYNKDKDYFKFLSDYLSIKKIKKSVFHLLDSWKSP